MRYPFLALMMVVAGCSSSPPQRPGGYYKDDGPHANPPANLASIPDAVPISEPLHKYANRPYEVFGRKYTPMAALQPFRQRGMASWYGKKFHGQKTSSGETYDMYKMTAAHPTLPIPSYVRVTHVGNGKSVVVRVNDRGPFHAGRIIDLSYVAAYKLGYIGAGSAQVEVEALVPGQPSRRAGL
jgi:rare lipoprotein A